MPTPIPSSVAELTSAWFSKVLGADISSVEVVDAHSGTTGRALMRLTTRAPLPDTLFVKLQPFLQEQRDFVRRVGMGVSEAGFYAAVGNEVPVRVPRVWHSSFDESDGTFIMVLEDLTASGCRFPIPDDPDVVEVAASHIHELANLHAHYWEQELPWLHSQVLGADGGRSQETRMAAMATIVQSAVDQFADEYPPEFRKLSEIFISSYRDVAILWNEGERTLIHGDNHIGNLFLDNGRAGFFDWAVASHAPGMRDVSYFLCNSLPTELRRSEECSLISRYLGDLATLGVGLDESVAYNQYRLFAVYSWISAATTAAMGSQWQPIAIGRLGMTRTTQAIIDLDVIGLLTERLGSS